jgi:hypothetical protein
MTAVLAVRIPVTEVAALDRAALRLGLRRSDLARWAVSALVEACEHKTTTTTKEAHSNG